MGDERNHRGSSRRWLVTALDNSLRRLGVDHVDLYQIHRWDPTTSDEETLSALTDLQRAGKIRYFGSSTFPAYRIVQAQWAAREHHLSRYVTEQPSYSILQRGIETHVLPVTEEYGLGVLAWSPLASGWLSGAIRDGRDITTNRSAFMPQRFDTTIPANRAKLDAVEQLAAVADEAGLTMIQLALGFVTAHPAVTSAIIGPRTHRPPALATRRRRHRAHRRRARRDRRDRRPRRRPRRTREVRHPARPARPVAATPLISAHLHPAVRASSVRPDRCRDRVRGGWRGARRSVSRFRLRRVHHRHVPPGIRYHAARHRNAWYRAGPRPAVLSMLND